MPLTCMESPATKQHEAIETISDLVDQLPPLPVARILVTDSLLMIHRRVGFQPGLAMTIECRASIQWSIRREVHYPRPGRRMICMHPGAVAGDAELERAVVGVERPVGDRDPDDALDRVPELGAQKRFRARSGVVALHVEVLLERELPDLV